MEKQFELGRFEGRWYEIARIPRDYDELCHNTVAEYRLTSAGKLDVHHSCRLGSANGSDYDVHASAQAEDPKTPAKLSLQIGLYTGAYWVMEVDDAYQHALIGHPSRLMLWILSRKPSLADSDYQALLAMAEQQGFNTGLLRRTPQTP